MSEQTPTPVPAPVPEKHDNRLRIGAVIAVLAVVAFVAWLLVSSNQKSSTPQASPSAAAPITPVGPKVVSVDELKQVPDQVGNPIYWAGEAPGKDLELTIGADRAVYVRYLPKGTPAGVDKPAFLTVATYPRPDAYALVQAGGSRPGAVAVEDAGGALVTTESQQSTNAYFAFEGTPLLVEVFDPKPGKAFEEIQSGRVQLVQ